MVTPAVAAYVPSYANRVPYITAAEFKSAPTGVDTSQLVPTRSVPSQEAVLVATIERASAWVDSICYQVLAATNEMQVGVYRPRRDGSVHVPVDFSPLIAVTGISVGWDPSGLSPLVDLSSVWIQRKVCRFALSGGPLPVWGDQFAVGPVYVQLGYIAGYSNTVLDDDADAADTSVVVDSPLGIQAGLPMTIADGANTEVVVVGPGYVFGSVTVPLTAPLGAAHTAGVSISALPPAVKQATISLTSALIKTRGSEAISMSSISEQPSTTDLIASGGRADVEVATALLAPFVRAR